MTPQEQIDFLVGPQVPIGTAWFDRTFVTKARLHGEAFPATSPTATDPALDDFINRNYYDLGLALYIAHRRTGDVGFQTLARKVADAWWQSPHIKEGTVRTFDTFTYTPRNSSLGGLILRALDGRAELWDWINAYTRAQFDAWLKIRINNLQLHNGVRDGAFMLQYAAWLAKVLPESFPLQAGGTATNGAALRAQYVADIEAITVNYFYRLQFMDGSWRWDDYDASGGPYIGIMQPFMVGLLLCALCDAHQVVTSPVAKTTIESMILTGCRHLYSGGPYSRQVVPHFNVNLRGLHYLYHGGTATDPSKYEKGDFPFDTTVNWHVPSARQAISTILPAFGYAYKISGDDFFKAAGDEMFDAAYNGTDGVRAMMDDTAKNFNQHARRVASYLVWAGQPGSQPAPLPTPDPLPTQPLPTQPTKTPSPDGTKGALIVDSELATWTIGLQKQTLRNNTQVDSGQGTEYKYVDKVVYVWGDIDKIDKIDVAPRNWYRWSGSSWSSVGPDEPGVTPTPTPVPQPTPTPVPTPVPKPIPASPRALRWPTSLNDLMVLIQAQARESYRPSGRPVPRPANQPKGTYVEFVKF